jgi:hypothetical protein
VDTLEEIESPINNQKKKCIRDKWTEEDIDKFYERQLEVTRLRKNLDTGEGWDLGYQSYLANMITPSKKTKKTKHDMLKRVFLDDVESVTESTLNNNHNSSSKFGVVDMKHNDMVDNEQIDISNEEED